MPVIKISDLPVAAPLVGDEILPIVQNGVTSQVEISQVGSSVFIQETPPVTSSSKYMWWETDGAGELVSLWVETNGS